MKSLDSFPNGVENEWSFGTKEEKLSKLHSLASEVVALVDLSIFDSNEHDNEGVKDHVHEYGKETLSLGLLYMEFQDAIREGDGESVLNCWRYFMILFKATGHRNYAIEAFISLAQYQWFLPPRQAMQLKYSRFINVHGRPKCNIPCDLYMEHLNRMVKSCVQHLGANKTERSIQRIDKCIGQIDKNLTCYDQQNAYSFCSP